MEKKQGYNPEGSAEAGSHHCIDELNKVAVPSKSSLTYSQYLQIDTILSAQTLLSDPVEHDEMLFIIIHQAYELWFKQLLHEVDGCATFLKKRQLMRVMAGFKRISAIQKLLIQQVDVLETMAPDDFARFRDLLNPASGFQSVQFRLFEIKMGLKDQRYLKFYAHDSMQHDRIAKAFEEPSLYDYFLTYMLSRQYQVPSESIGRQAAALMLPNPQLVDVFEVIYRNPYEHADIYVVLETLMDIDQNLTLWRYRHVSMVQRIIGSHRGTGGSSGAGYLNQTLDKCCFPEIWAVRDKLGSHRMPST